MRSACGGPKDRLDSPDLQDMSELLASKENEVKRELEEKRESEAWMDFPGSLGMQDSRAGLALLVWQDPREKRVTWDLRACLVYQARWCSERA